MKKIGVIFLFLVGLITITGCAQDSSGIEDTIHDTLTAAVEAEKGVDDLQMALNEHSSKEKEIYDEIIELPIAEHDKLADMVKLAEDELTASIGIIKEVQAQLSESKLHIAELKHMTNELSDEEKQTLFIELDEKMNERLDHLEAYYNTYLEVIESSGRLYQLFLSEGFQTSTVFEGIEEVNVLYDELTDMNSLINTSTEEVNKLKTTFYDLIND